MSAMILDAIKDYFDREFPDEDIILEEGRRVNVLAESIGVDENFEFEAWDAMLTVDILDNKLITSFHRGQDDVVEVVEDTTEEELEYIFNNLSYDELSECVHDIFREKFPDSEEREYFQGYVVEIIRSYLGNQKLIDIRYKDIKDICLTLSKKCSINEWVSGRHNDEIKAEIDHLLNSKAS